MSMQTINNGDSALQVRTKVNENFTELNDRVEVLENTDVEDIELYIGKSVPLTGTILSVTGNNVVGSGTLFTTEFAQYDQILLDADKRQVVTINEIIDDTHLTIYEELTEGFYNVKTAKVVVGDDEDDGLSPETALATMNRAMEIIPNNFEGYAVINILRLNDPGDILINNKQGLQLSLVGTNNNYNNDIKPISVGGRYTSIINNNLTQLYITGLWLTVLEVSGCNGLIDISDCNIEYGFGIQNCSGGIVISTCTGSIDSGISVRNSGLARIGFSDITHIWCEGGKLISYNNTVDTLEVAVGGEIVKVATVPIGDEINDGTGIIR